MRTTRITSFALLGTLFALGLPLALAGPASAATVTVTTTDDVVDAGDGLVSLREAFSQITPVGQDDVIVLAAGATYELDLCGPPEDLNATGDIDFVAGGSGTNTIQGNGATIEQTCGGERVVHASGSAALVFTDVTLRGGTAETGSAISAGGALTLDGVEVTGNGQGPSATTGSAVHVGETTGGLTITDSSIHDNTAVGVRSFTPAEVEATSFVENRLGGFQQFGDTVVVEDSVFTGNGTISLNNGGGITTNNTALTVTGSTFTGNEGANGGAVRNSDGTTTVRNSTLTQNAATLGGGIYGYDGDATPGNDDLVLEHVTLYGNVDVQGPNHVDIAGDLTARATALGQSTAVDSCDVGGTTTSQGANVDSGHGCVGGGVGDLQDVGDLVLEGSSPGDGTTVGETVRLPGVGSPLVDRLPVGQCGGTSATDQAGRLRGADADFDGVDACDAGAAERPQGQPFVDVAGSHPFFTEIGWMAWNGISTGSQPGPTYKPSDAVSRQAMSAFLYRLAGSPAFADPATATFSDVGPSNPFFTEVEWMDAEHITTGFPGGLFKPVAPVTRQSMSAFMFRMAGEPAGPFPAPGFSDVGAGHPFYEQISWMADSGVSEGYQDGTFKPAAPVTRQAMSAFMQRFAQQV
jgi:hypothetical protein